MTANVGRLVVAIALVAWARGSGSEPEGLKARLGPVVEAQEEAHRRFLDELERATTDEAREAAGDRYAEGVAGRTGRVLELVRDRPQDPAVVEGLLFVIRTARRGPGDASYRAMEILLRDHVRDPGMGAVCEQVFHFAHAPVAESLLRAVLGRHPDREVRARACHSLAFCLELRAGMVRAIREGRMPIERYVHEWQRAEAERLVTDADPAALVAESCALLERVVAEFADVEDWFSHRPLGEIASGVLFARRSLRVGQAAPDITGDDPDGKPFSLGEYRGKVVLLTFSANWCGPCVGMYPQERALVERWDGRPFALVSVNCDEDVATLRASIISGEITWRCWWDGGVIGPISARWGVQGMPASFLLDRRGVIRFKDLRGKELDDSVASLMAESEDERPK